MTADKKQLFKFYFRMFNDGMLPPEEEYNFDSEIGRRHRFDFAWPDRKIAVEVEGNAWHTAGGGRHMQDSDMEKYNIAAVLGWRVLRFSPGMLNSDPENCIETVRKALR